MAEQARDWRLEPRVRAACGADVRELCQFEADTDALVPSSAVRMCVVQFRKDLGSGACQAAVHRALARAVSDVRFEPRVQEGCAQDITKICVGVPRRCVSRAKQCDCDEQPTRAMSCRHPASGRAAVP
jgi:hypothetical protein